MLGRGEKAKQGNVSGGLRQYNNLYLGIVKDNRDFENMGRLLVYLPEDGGDPNDPENYVVVNYMSPFAGFTHLDFVVSGSKKYTESQRSYGFWMIPPDIDTEVIVGFLQGQSYKGIWMGCMYGDKTNHMVPGLASNISPDQPPSPLAPVVEHNKKTPEIDPRIGPRPVFDPLHIGICSQGLYSDPERGPTSASAQRDSPSQVFGHITPQGHQMYIDDGQLDQDCVNALDLKGLRGWRNCRKKNVNEYIRLRTKGGAQVLINDTQGYIYINSKLGRSWVEISDIGIDLFSEGTISVRSQGDLNLKSDSNVNIEANNEIRMHSRNDTQMLQSNGNFHLKTAKEQRYTSGQTMHFKSAANMLRRAAGIINDKAAVILHQTGPDAAPAYEVPRQDLPDTIPPACLYKRTTHNTITSRLPSHEPFVGHPKSTLMITANFGVFRPATGSKNTLFDQTVKVQQDKEIESRPQPDKEIPLDDKPKNITRSPCKKDFDTGSGNVQKVNTVATDTVKLPGGFKASQEVIGGIKEASNVSGIDNGYLMAVAAQESGFNPDAKATTSSATGLYQFIDGTWDNMVSRYGTKYGITKEDRCDARSNAIMGALYAKENKDYLERRIGREATGTDLYMAHFLGAGGASTFLKGDPNATAVSIVGPKVANANKTIFYKNGDVNQPRTQNEVYKLMQQKIEPKSTTFRNGSYGTSI